MKKYILFSIIFLGVLFFAKVSFVSADTHTASTCSYADVNTAVSAASPGDAVIIPAMGSPCTWANTLTVTRGMNLVGSGNPVIIGNRVLIIWQGNSTAQSNHETFTLDGIIFDGNNGSIPNNESLVRARNDSVNYTNFIARNCTLRNVAAGRGFHIKGTVYGVAYSNILDRIPVFFEAQGNDYNSWNNFTQAYGVAENFYFEDNTIIFSSSYRAGYSGWTESGQGGRVVARYNTWDYTNAVAPGEFWDAHGCQTPPNCQNYGTMVAEYYGNKIINQLNAYRWMAHRGGWGLIFYNFLAGNTSPYNGVTEYFCSSCAPGGFQQKVTNTYYFRNFTNGTEKAFTIYSAGDGCPSDPVVENVDFFNYNPSFNGTTGVGCGTLASRPATCTAGVGYWATSQSCSNMTGMVGASPSTPISGTLYKCTSANTWTAYYAPYTYPHPLRSESSSQPCTYTYSDWGSCQSNNTQTRTVISSSPSGCTGTPVLTQSCVYVPPTDTQAPTVTAFTIPSTSNSLTVSITTFTATDNIGVTGYMVTESATAPSASATGWTATQPSSYTFTSAGTKTLYAWAKDAAGNVSTSRSASVTTQSASVSATYYVSPTGSAQWNQCANINTPCSMATANTNAQAGDTIYLRSGTYSTYIEPRNSGTVAQRITFQNYGSEIVTIQNAAYGIYLNSKSYITVQGINFYNLDEFLWIQNGSNHNIIAYCNFDQHRNRGWSGSKIYLSSSYNWVHHSRFSKYGECTAGGSDAGSVFDIGNEEDAQDISNYNLIENNTMYHAGHHVLGVYGRYNVIRNNYLHNEAWSRGKGNRTGPTPIL